jgi:hypothetical protein
MRRGALAVSLCATAMAVPSTLSGAQAASPRTTRTYKAHVVT